MSEGSEELTRRAKARLGSTLDEKWHLDSLLGVGGMASVYGATHRNGKRAAVKVLHPEVALNASVKSRFLREGWVANKVEHPGAVSVLDDDEAPDGSVFLVMELLEGETLEAQCKFDLKLACGDVLVIADQVLDVLIAAHDKNIVHRDLKPGNLFLTKEGSVKVLDFGIARLRELSSGQAPSATTVSSMGTPGFMPPEQARGRWEEVDGRADLFAVGATMFTMLTGRFIHEESTINEQLLASMTKPAPSISAVEPSVPAAVAAVIDRALAFDRSDRWPDARSMQEAVRSAYQQTVGRPIRHSTRLLVTVRVPMTDPVESAPTLDVSESGAVKAIVSLPSSSSAAKPVAVTTPSAGVRDPQRARTRGLSLAVGGAALVGIAVIAVVALRTPSRALAVAAPSPSEAPPIGTTAATIAAPAPSGSPAFAAPAPSESPQAPALPTHRAVASPPVAHAPASAPAPSATPPPAVSVDIFGRRR